MVVRFFRLGNKKTRRKIISSNTYNKSRQDVIIAAITSNTKRSLVGDTRIIQWKDAGLLFPSVVTGILQTIHKNMLERKLGSLPEKDFLKVQKNLKKTIGF